MDTITVNSLQERIDTIGERLVDAANISIPEAVKSYGGVDGAVAAIVDYIEEQYKIIDYDGTAYAHVERAVRRVVERDAE